MADYVIPITDTKAQVAGRLVDFATGHSELRQEHKDWLLSAVVPKAKENSRSWIDLMGYASKLGNDIDNKRLSDARCAAVQKFITDSLPDKQAPNFPYVEGRGTRDSGSVPFDDSREYRSVSVFLYEGWKPPMEDAHHVDKRLVLKQTKEDRSINREPREPGGGHYAFELAKFAKVVYQDIERTNRHPVETGDPDRGQSIKEEKSDIDSKFVLLKVEIDRQFVQGSVEMHFGYYTIPFTLTRTYKYSYGTGSRDQQVTVVRNTRFTESNGTSGSYSDNFQCAQPVNYIDP